MCDHLLPSRESDIQSVCQGVDVRPLTSIKGVGHTICLSGGGCATTYFHQRSRTYNLFVRGGGCATTYFHHRSRTYNLFVRGWMCDHLLPSQELDTYNLFVRGWMHGHFFPFVKHTYSFSQIKQIEIILSSWFKSKSILLCHKTLLICNVLYDVMTSFDSWNLLLPRRWVPHEMVSLDLSSICH